MFGFWKKKNTVPITEEDRAWIEKNLVWLHENVVNLRKQPTVLPTREFFDWEFTGKEKDARYVLQRLGKLCRVDVSRVRLSFYSQQTLDFGNGMATRPEEDEKGAAGYYSFDGDESEIQIEIGQLQNPASLVATMAHELSHYVLIGLYDYGHDDDQENEYLTDLLAIAYGFGIFQGNTAFQRSAWQSGGGSGWSIGKQGYLPKQVTAYAMAVIELYKGRSEQTWGQYLEKDFGKYFNRSVGFVFENPHLVHVK